MSITQETIIEQLEKIDENVELFGRDAMFTKMRIEELVELMESSDMDEVEAGVIDWANEYVKA